MLSGGAQKQRVCKQEWLAQYAPRRTSALESLIPQWLRLPVHEPSLVLWVAPPISETGRQWEGVGNPHRPYPGGSLNREQKFFLVWNFSSRLVAVLSRVTEGMKGCAATEKTRGGEFV